MFFRLFLRDPGHWNSRGMSVPPVGSKWTQTQLEAWVLYITVYYIEDAVKMDIDGATSQGSWHISE